MCKSRRRFHELEPEVERPEERRGEERVNCGAEIVPEAGQRDFGGPSPSADRLLRFQDEDGAAGLGERDGSREAVRPRADDDRV
jgi:hypothetical protein